MLEERFWSKVNKTSECWLWTGSCDKIGYGRFDVNGKAMYAHRVSWLLTGNTIPEELIVRHKCRSKNCVNPEHLTLGTYEDNNGADRRRDGTDFIGERNPNGTLTEEQVREIRRRSTENQRILAEEFGVKRGHISSIILRKTWRHLVI